MNQSHNKESRPQLNQGVLKQNIQKSHNGVSHDIKENEDKNHNYNLHKQKDNIPKYTNQYRAKLHRKKLTDLIIMQETKVHNRNI